MHRLIIILIGLLFASTLNAEPMLHPIQGKPIPFSSLQGKWVLINYWASWCETCVAEIPELNQFYEKNKDKVALFAVNYDMVSAEMLQLLNNEHHIQYIGLAEDPAIPLHLGDIRGVPVTFVFNPQGELIKTLYGGLKARQLSQLIRPAKSGVFG